MEMQLQLGQVDIKDINFDLNSRDEIPKVLIGLQSVYCDSQTRKEIFGVLTNLVPENIDPTKGRKGMDLWNILVLGTIRLSCNWDYDKLQEIANNHRTLRMMLGHSPMDWDYRYALQTIKDNVSLFTTEVFDKINQIVVRHGHKVLGKKPDEEIHGSCDSFPVETDVHFPTDISLLLDAIRKIISLIMSLCDDLGIKGWRQGISNLKKTKKVFNRVRKLKKSNSKDPKKKAEKNRLIVIAHKLYIELAKTIVEKAKLVLMEIDTSNDIMLQHRVGVIFKYIAHAERQIEQIHRRVIEGETIAHHEKVFSIFEEHTEWISKGKAGVPVELGLNVCIVKDQFGLVLHHRVMQNETDDKVAVPIIVETKVRFREITSCSFDKGFHSPENQKKLAEILDKVILPQKGKLSAARRKIESSEGFRSARRKHSAVESSINALENSGLDRCPDHGIHGFKRYVGLAILARNLQTIGHAVQQKELKRAKRRIKLKLVA